MNISELRSGLAYVEACLQDIHTRADGVALEGDDAAGWSAGVEYVEASRAAIADYEAREAVIARAATHGQSGDGARSAPAQINKRDLHDLSDLRYGAPASEVRDRARAVIDGVGGLRDDHREQAERVMGATDRDGAVARHIVTTGSPEYRSAFIKALSGEGDTWTVSEKAAVSAVRAASLTGNAGGFAVPFTLDTTIIDTGAHSTNPFRQISRVVQTTTNSWNGVSSAGVTASWDGEAAEVSDDAPTLAQQPIPVFKGAAFVPFSVEVGMDWAGMESDIRVMIQRAKDDLEGAAFVSGNGTTAPQGVTTALDGTASEIAPVTAETFAVADVYKLESSLEARYGARASFVAHKVWYNAIRQFDTAGGSHLWDHIGAGRPSQLLGYNAYESSDMDNVLPNAAATADNFGILLGDFSEGYVIADRIGLSVELVPHLFATANNRPSGQRGFYAFWRTGAKVVNINAIKMLSIPTAA
jgi:HK97 family phage major capsid protein